MNKNSHINTAIKALERQIDKYHQQAQKEIDKSNTHTQNAEFFLKQASQLSEQVKSLNAENGNQITKTALAEK